MNHKFLVLATGIGGLLLLPIQSFPLNLAVPGVVAQTVTSQVSPEQLQKLQKLAQSITVKVLSGDSGGSGILIKKEGQVYTVLTNQHVLAPGKSTRIQTPDGSLHPATLVTGVNFQGKDLALLQFRASADYAVASLTNLATVAVNEPIFAAGFPFDADSSQPGGFTLATGQVLLVPERAFKEGYQIGYSNNIEKGMSGGPILTREGQVIGINGIHADPLWGDPYVYEDGSRPTDALRDLMSRYSWGIPIQTFAQLAPQYASQEALAAGTPTATEENLPPIANDVNNIAQQITVLIRWEKGNGSGVIVGKKGNIYTVLTAAHVVRNKTTVEVVTPDGKGYSIAVDDSTVKEISGADLAIFQFRSEQNYRVATLANYDLKYDSQTESGGFIFVSGWAGGGAGKPRRLFSAGEGLSGNFLGSVLAKNSLSLTYGYGLVYSNLTEEGMSGGPVLDMRGRVIGIHGRADVEKITDKAGRIRQIPLGISLGVPISAFVNRLKEVGLEGELRVETFPPPPLTEEEVKAVMQALFNPKEPDANADAIDWLNYGWEVLRAASFESRTEKVIAAFDRAIQLDPNLYQAWYLRSIALISSDKYQDALESLDKVIQIKPDLSPAWRWRGFVLVNLERYQEALESFDRASQLDPKDFDVRNFKTLMLIALERYPEALEAANQIVKSYPAAWSYAVRGEVRARLNDYGGAIDDYTQAILLSTVLIDGTIYRARGNVRRQLKDYQGALADLNEAVRLDPNDAVNFRKRGDVRRQLKDYQGALADYAEAIRLDPQDKETYNSINLLNKDLIDAYTEVIRLKPDLPEAYYRRGFLRAFQGEYQGAIEDYNQALLRIQEIAGIGIQPEINAQTKILTIVAVTDNLPAHKGEIKAGDQILEIDGKPTANLNIEEVVNLLRGQKGTQVTLRISRQGKGEFKVTLTREQIIDPQLAEVYYNRGLARLELKDKQGAREDLQKAADLYQQQNNIEMYQTALEKLKEIQ